MTKADKIEKNIMRMAKIGAIGAVVLYLLGKHKKESTSGIGATKRRIFKELSLAQNAGVDFTKKYDELSPEEIDALQKVSADTGYTETYYKSLKKAYDAVSGIGSSYNVKDADGNICLTWIDNPQEDIERQQRALEAEQRAAEARKRLNKTRRASTQQSLFGIGYPAARKPYWWGVKSVQFISHGEWSDPEVYYMGKFYNAVELEQAMYEWWAEEVNNEDTKLDYEEWMKKNASNAKYAVLPYMQPTGYMDANGWRVDY